MKKNSEIIVDIENIFEHFKKEKDISLINYIASLVKEENSEAWDQGYDEGYVEAYNEVELEKNTYISDMQDEHMGKIAALQGEIAILQKKLDGKHE